MTDEELAVDVVEKDEVVVIDGVDAVDSDVEEAVLEIDEFEMKDVAAVERVDVTLELGAGGIQELEADVNQEFEADAVANGVDYVVEKQYGDAVVDEVNGNPLFVDVEYEDVAVDLTVEDDVEHDVADVVDDELHAVVGAGEILVAYAVDDAAGCNVEYYLDSHELPPLEFYGISLYHHHHELPIKIF